jgi:hypothetical protein
MRLNIWVTSFPRKRVAADPQKVAAILEWLVLRNIKELKGFLGLTNYYRKFMKHYGIIARSLTDLLKKNNFKWSSEAQKTFEALKIAMRTTPVLKLLNF